jgi:hypothetical protein
MIDGYLSMLFNSMQWLSTYQKDKS